MNLKGFFKKGLTQRSRVPRIKPNIFFRWVVIVISYLIIFSLLDLFSQQFQIYPGVVAWYPPDGVSFAFLVAFGPWFAPVVALASIISSSIIFNFTAPLSPLIAWAAVLSISYGIIAFFIRRYRVKTAKKLSVRSMLVWMAFAIGVVTFLAIVSVSNLVQFGSVPKAEALSATIQWWIGEMIGLLVFTPFLMIYVMPWIIRFGEGKRIIPRRRKFVFRHNPEGIVQAVSMLVILYLVFGVQSLQQFHLHYLIVIPLIWVAMRLGFNRTTFAIVLTNFGIMIAVWLFKFQHSQLAEYQFVMFGIFFSVLVIGAIVSKQKTSDEEFRKKEVLFRALVEKASEGILLVNKKRRIEYHSPAASRILGYDEKQSQVGLNAALFTHPEDEPELHRLFEEMLKIPSKVVVAQYRVMHQDGEWRWIESTFTNQLNNLNIKAIVVNFREITERKLTEEALKQSERRFRALVENSQEEISLLTADGILIYESPNAHRPLGYPQNTFVGKSLFDIFHPDEKTLAIELFKTIAKTSGMVTKATFRARHKDGSYVWMEGYISNMLDDPAVEAVVLNYSDVTDRVETEKRIEILARIPDESPNPVMRMNGDGLLLYANQQSEKILELWNCSVNEYAPKYMVDIANVAFLRKENIPVEIKCEGRVYAITVTPIIETGYINLYGRDITKRIRAEEKLQISNDELSMLFQLSHSLAEADNLGHIFDIVNIHAVESMHNTFARIALLENEHFVMKAGFPAREINKSFRLGESISVTKLPFSQRMLKENEIKVINVGDPEIGEEEKNILFINEAKCVCLVPLRTSDSSAESETLVGLLMLGESGKEDFEPFSAEKQRLIQTIGASAAIAIRRMLLREQTEQRLQQLVALSEIDLAIISNSDIYTRLDVVCRQILQQLKVDAADIWAFEPSKQQLEFISSRGFETSAFEKAKPVRLDEGMLGQAFVKRQIIYISNITEQNKNPRFAEALAQEPFIGYYAVPLIANNEVKGVLEIFHRTELAGGPEWMNFLQILANQAAIAIDNSLLLSDLKQSNSELIQAYDATIQGWSRALDLRDNETEGHTQRVTELTMKLARMFGLPEEELIHVRRGALLHDIGKMGVPDRILLKPGPLTDEEWVVMRQHTTFAYELLSPISFLKPALDIPMCHHEKWDGTGYPHGLSGDQIPFAARIFSVVDVWDALTSDRPYRAAWPEEKVLDYICSLSGTQFDPQVVKVCLEPGFLTGTPRERAGMEQMQWSESYSVGVSELDLQHQKLIGMINRLISATGTNQIHSETITSLLDEMTRYVQIHFSTEERLMSNNGFEAFDEHKVQHLGFQTRIAEFYNSMGKDPKETADELLEYLREWWDHHILEEDMAYKELFIEKGLS